MASKDGERSFPWASVACPRRRPPPFPGPKPWCAGEPAP